MQRGGSSHEPAPAAARWFEVVAARDDAYLALEALATAGCVEIEWHAADATLSTAPGGAAARLKEFGQLARRYGRYWPPPPRCTWR